MPAETMMIAPKPNNEKERIAALYEYNILDSISEKDYDDITHIAAEICNMPISLISIIDHDRQWFKSKVGLDEQETHRDVAFCTHAILNPKEMFIINDVRKDDRFHDNPLVTGTPNIGFYAGVPLLNNSGFPLGTLCVIDKKANDLTREQKETLKALARQVVANFETRKMNLNLAAQKAQLEELNKDLNRFAYVVAHDVKSPCSSFAMSAAYLKDTYANVLDAEGIKFLDEMESTAKSAIAMVDGILRHTQMVNSSEIIKDHFTFGDIMDEVKKLIPIPAEFTFGINNKDVELFAPRYMLMQVLLNLCTNAIKYNDKWHGEVAVSVEDKGASYVFSVKDNGIGITPADHKRIFDLFSTLGLYDRYNNQGSGVGLATAKRLVQKMNGDIRIESEPGIGSTFSFTISK